MSDLHWIEAATLGPEAARETWALAARHALADVAGEYHAVITTTELADTVQRRSRIRTRSAAGNWIGDVLYRVAAECHRRREPILSALCVQPNGTMGEWYADTVQHLRGERVEDPIRHAAGERLECYRVHGAELPPDGGEPALPPQLTQPARSPARSSTVGAPRGTRVPKPAAAGKAAPAPAPAPAVCPTCFMALPASGQCDFCD